MTRLLLADLRHHAATWAWTTVVAVVTGACVFGQFMVMRGSLVSARAIGDASLIEAASVVSSFIIASVVLAAAAVLSFLLERHFSPRRRVPQGMNRTQLRHITA